MSDRIPTLADVCSAIAEGHIPAAIDGSMYQVNALELRRYFTGLRPLPTISTTSDPSSHPDPSAWSASTTPSVA
ncbi:MAG: hypothetical protein JO011_16590 [Ktedonobacteraceae bacterium]|nr:hypothetical protein [Ktedonobacteraceae bacterium]MBV9712523.1 hypothetical protein [Ktedonobacteraceae bacterium]